ncbi:MAG: hypothetical protein V4563_17785 [Pseudomonadota bacterium]
MNNVLEELIGELHDRVGLCRCCGKKKCAGKQSGSILPNNIKVVEMLAAIDAVEQKLKKCPA